jgi:CHAT domain-containing protein
MTEKEQNLIELGHGYYKRGNYYNALNCFLEVKASFEKCNDPSEVLNYALILNKIGLLKQEWGDYKEARNNFFLAINILRDVLLHCTRLYESVNYYFEDEDNKNLSKEIDIMKQYSIESNRLYTRDDWLYSKYSWDYYECKNKIIAMKYGMELLLLKIKRLYADLINNITVNNKRFFFQSIIYRIKIKKIYIEAEKITEKLYKKNSVLINNGKQLYTAIENSKKAEGFFLDTINNIEKIMGYPDKEDYYNEAKNEINLELLQSNYVKYADFLIHVGIVYLNNGSYWQAKSEFKKAKLFINESKTDEKHFQYALDLITTGNGFYHEYKDDYQASKYYSEALLIYDKLLGYGYSPFLYNLYWTWISLGKYEKALEFKKNFDQQYKNRFSHDFLIYSKSQREISWHTGRLESTYLLSCFNSWFNYIPESNALNYDNVLFSKGLLLRAANAVRDSVYSSGNQNLIEKFEKLCNLYQEISDMKKNEKIDKIKIIMMEEQAEKIDRTIMQSLSAYKEASENWKAGTNLGWQDVRDNLREGEAAVEFVSFNLSYRNYGIEWTTGGNQYAALVLRPDMESPKWVFLCKEADLAGLFTTLSGETPEKQTEILYGENSGLYSNVWQPLESILEGVKTVYYSPSGLLHKVSFNAIPAKGERLMDLYDLNLVSSTREVVNRNKKNTHKPGSAVIFGGIKYNLSEEDINKEMQDDSNPHDKFRDGGKLTALANTVLESAFIQRQFEENKIHCDLYTGAEGNKKNFMNLDREKTNVIHLATHGFFIDDIKKEYKENWLLERVRKGINDNDNPLRRSGIALAGANNWLEESPLKCPDNGILLADDVASMNLEGADIVVLSACETALGKVDNSEGVFGLQWAFKLAGAQTLVMSLWKVEDESTSELMIKFYQNWLSEGMSKQESFKNAQKQLREQYLSPYHWAAFVMID